MTGGNCENIEDALTEMEHLNKWHLPPMVIYYFHDVCVSGRMTVERAWTGKGTRACELLRWYLRVKAVIFADFVYFL